MKNIPRPITPADRQVWQPLFEAYLAFYKTSRTPEVIDVAFQRMTSGADHEFRGLCLERDGKMVGFTHFLRHRKMWDLADTMYLMDLYVTPEVRCSGVARTLIEAVYQIAREEGVSSVYWLTQENNHTAQALYDRVATKTDFFKYTKNL